MAQSEGEPEVEQQKPVETHEMLRGVVDNLLSDLKEGAGDRDKRRGVEEWLKSVSEKFPEFGVDRGLRDYYMAEATRLRSEFDSASEITEKLNLGRQVESLLDKAAEYDRRVSEK